MVEVNRGVAVAMALGPAAGLEIVDVLAGEPSLRSCHLLPSVLGDPVARLGCYEEAVAGLRRAAGLTRNVRERRLTRARGGGERGRGGGERAAALLTVRTGCCVVAYGRNAPGIVMHPTGSLVMYIGTIPFTEITRAARVPSLHDASGSIT